MRGWTLVVLTLASLLTAAALLPPDMGKGPMAEMRYVVPLLAVGAAMGAVALTILWIAWRPAAPVAALLLAATNWLYFGFFAERLDRAEAGWPPTLYRYAMELCNPYQTGNEAMIDLLDKLPAGTTRADLAAVYDLSADVLRPQAALLRSVDGEKADTRRPAEATSGLRVRRAGASPR